LQSSPQSQQSAHTLLSLPHLPTQSRHFVQLPLVHLFGCVQQSQQSAHTVLSLPHLPTQSRHFVQVPLVHLFGCVQQSQQSAHTVLSSGHLPSQVRHLLQAGLLPQTVPGQPSVFFGHGQVHVSQATHLPQPPGQVTVCSQQEHGGGSSHSSQAHLAYSSTFSVIRITSFA